MYSGPLMSEELPLSEQRFDPAQLSDRGLPVRYLDAGEKVFLAKEDGDCLFVVIAGQIEIITVGQKLELVGPGGIFGEIALIDQGSRSASAMAATESQVFQIDRAAFLDLVSQEPTFAHHVMTALVARMRRAEARD